MTKYYKTNEQAWDEVMKSFNEFEKSKAICQKLFGQDNLIGLTEKQREAYLDAI